MKETKKVKTTIKDFINKKYIIAGAGISAAFVTTGVVGYVRGYNKAKNIAGGIVDCIAEELKDPKDRTTFYNIWNYGVAKYFGKLGKN